MDDETKQPELKRVYSEQEQIAIVQLAARLQEQRGEVRTLTDIERAAAEAGIAPEFVREAARSLESREIVRATSRRAIVPAFRKALSSIGAYGAIVAFVFANVAAMSGLLLGDPRSPTLPSALVVAISFALVLPKRKEWKLVPAIAPIVAAIALIIVAQSFVRPHILDFRVNNAVMMIAVGQALIAYYLYRFRLSRPPRESNYGMPQTSLHSLA